MVPRRFYVVMAALVLAGLLLSACGPAATPSPTAAPAPTQPPQPTQAPAPTPTAAPKVKITSGSRRAKRWMLSLTSWSPIS